MVVVAVGDWVPCFRYGTSTAGAVDTVNGIITVNFLLVQVGAADQGVIGDIASVETEDEVITKRVVGPVLFRLSFIEDVSVVVHERIRVALLSDDGDLSFFATDLNDASQANEPFLWERVSQTSLVAGTVAEWPQPDFSHPGYSELDVRVARKLRRHEALVYSVQVAAQAGDFNVEDLVLVRPFLRTWARALG